MITRTRTRTGTGTGAISFRVEYRNHGRRETLVIVRYDSTRAAKLLREDKELAFGNVVTLAEARMLLA